MFTSLKNFIELRLGTGLIADEHTEADAFYLKTRPEHLHQLIAFLKTDPDLRLNLLDHIIALPKVSCGFFKSPGLDVYWCILYQLKSLKLPYRVSLVIDINPDMDSIRSIANHFPGARWLEEDISQACNLALVDLS